MLPMIQKSDFHLYVDNEIGRGSFGTVFKGTWAGTSVAVQQIKCGRDSMILSALKSKVLIHSFLHHPNIILIMAISVDKYEQWCIISELVGGPNLEEILFFETDKVPK